MRADEAIYRFFLERRRAKFTAEPVRINDCFVVSVGNITSGGTGKTPMVQLIARGLQNRGKRVAVVARGHGGTLSKQGALVSDGKKRFCSAQEAGDEALLHARSLPEIGVVIGLDRVAACRRAVAEFGCDVIVLDDGFQFWGLARDLDIVLLDARRPFGNGHLLPRGRLREPLEELRRADIFVLTRCDLAPKRQLAQNRVLVSKYGRAPLFQSNHVAVGLRNEASGEVSRLETLRGVSVGALSAIADNEGFRRSLKKNGARVVAALGAFDHHRWRENEVRDFVRRASQSDAKFLLTTEKDAVKLRPEWCAPLSLRSLQIEIEIAEEDKLWSQIDDVLRRQ